MGLPGDTLAGFGASFDQLIALSPQEIQVGLLKRLRGAPINRHTETYRMRYDPNPPYALLSNRDLDFATLQRLTRFARFWDLIGNSGRFKTTLPLILADQPFARFLQFSDVLYEITDSTWQIGLKRLFELTYTVMTQSFELSPMLVADVLYQDYLRSGEKGRLEFIQVSAENKLKQSVANKRQRQNLY
jgi:hypothetical protein